MLGHNCVINGRESQLGIFITYPQNSPDEDIIHVVNKLQLNRNIPVHWWINCVAVTGLLGEGEIIWKTNTTTSWLLNYKAEL
jgi:hypothetical protein